MKESVDFKSLLQKNGFKATAQRIALVSLLSRNHTPLSLKDISKKLAPKDIHDVTLYRMLASFKDAGLIRHVDLGDSVSYYEISDLKHDHHHIVCTNCKRVSDFVGCDAIALSKKALSQSKDFSKITHHSFEFFGLCNKCAH